VISSARLRAAPPDKGITFGSGVRRNLVSLLYHATIFISIPDIVFGGEKHKLTETARARKAP
jgi:hypothetical protein